MNDENKMILVGMNERSNEPFMNKKKKNRRIEEGKERKKEQEPRLIMKC